MGLNRFQVVMEPPSHVADSYSESMKYARNRAEPWFEVLTKSGGTSYEWTGIVASLEYPSHSEETLSALEAAHPLLTRLTTLKWESKELATFQLIVGRKTMGYYRNYSLAGYRTRLVQVVAGSAESIRIEESGDDPGEVGIGIHHRCQ